VAKLKLDGVEIEVPDSSPLVEVIKQQGTFISNLCYIDGIPPYAGCRTCLVEIEGARGLQLACTSRVNDGMEVRTQTAQVLDARQAVLSIINANHSDRCLTCHRRVHCMPGDICLRDDTVTHRCLTCAKNYRCELQTTNEMLHMANVEPWLGEERTYYESEAPEADRANPFLEFDPQMCIICTRCVRACDEIRHTGAVTLAGRGPTTVIAFGAGGAIHESNCDFCGACIDVCPTATLLEKPNKWIAKTEEWVSTTCNSCSVGCTLSMGVRNGKVVMVKPDRLNPFSDSQICVRGRFHYDAVTTRERLTRHLVRQGDLLVNTPYESALETASSLLADVVKAHGPESLGFLVAPWATNEEAYLAQRIARGVVGTENVDSTAGPVADAVEAALTSAFGTHVLPANLEDITTASVVVVIADDLESSHNVAALRVKDAVVNGGARLIAIGSRYSEVCDFIAPPPAGAMMPSPQRVHSAAPTGVWLRPTPGGEVATLAALTTLLGPTAVSAEASGIDPGQLSEAAAILRNLGDGKLAVVYAPSAASARLAGLGATAAANLAIAVKGTDAASSLHVLPVESNVNGIRDMGAKPGANGKGLREMLDGGVRALVVVGDNPMLLTPGKDGVEAALRGLDALVVIDGLRSETADHAHVVFADLPSYGKDGTRTNADRRIGRVTKAEAATGDQRDSLDILNGLGYTLAAALSKQYTPAGDTAEAVMAEAAATVPGYAAATYARLESGRTRALAATPSKAEPQPVSLPQLPDADDGLLLTTSRTLYTSLEGATIRSDEADKLHREEFVEINPADASALGILQNHPVVISNGAQELIAPAALTDAVAAGSVHLPSYFEGGAVNRLLPADGRPTTVTLRPA
jgi:predicted molibdopterin-dependent oxidoreductase YjgC